MPLIKSFESKSDSVGVAFYDIDRLRHQYFKPGWINMIFQILDRI
jgi:hypothetical protein